MEQPQDVFHNPTVTLVIKKKKKQKHLQNSNYFKIT